MNYGASLYGLLWTHEVHDGIAALAESGFGGVEVMAATPHASPSELAPNRRTALRSAIERSGLELLSVNAPTLDFNLASPERPLRDAAVAHYEAILRLAADLAAPRVVVAPGRVHPLQRPPMDRVRSWAVESITRLVRLAEELDVSIALENLPFGLFERVAELHEVCAQVGSARLGITLDVANAHGHEDPVESLDRFGESILLVQVSDSSRARWTHGEVGSGEIDFARLWPAIRAHPVPVVLEVTEPPGIGPLARSRAALDAILEPA
nr:sugar phosphate isomerase/epimerase family protein [Micromonospora sp. DSM 115978]